MSNPSPYITTLTFLASLAPASERNCHCPIACRKCPGMAKFRLTEYGYRNWGPELVRYRIDPNQFPQRNSVLLGPDGKSVPFQINEGMLSFVAEFGQGSNGGLQA